MASDGKLGLSLRLPPEVIESLQSRHEIEVNPQEKSAAGPLDNEEDESQVSSRANSFGSFRGLGSGTTRLPSSRSF
jgi:hypothetical protein